MFSNTLCLFIKAFLLISLFSRGCGSGEEEETCNPLLLDAMLRPDATIWNAYMDESQVLDEFLFLPIFGLSLKWCYCSSCYTNETNEDPNACRTCHDNSLGSSIEEKFLEKKKMLGLKDWDRKVTSVVTAAYGQYQLWTDEIRTIVMRELMCNDAENKRKTGCIFRVKTALLGKGKAYPFYSRLKDFFEKKQETLLQRLTAWYDPEGHLIADGD